jgi:hypothetical protein
MRKLRRQFRGNREELSTAAPHAAREDAWATSCSASPPVLSLCVGMSRAGWAARPAGLVAAHLAGLFSFFSTRKQQGKFPK